MCPPKKELTRYSTIFYDVFDTVTQVIAYCESEEVFKTQMDALHADLVTYNQLYDIYNDYPSVTNVKTINDNAGKAPVEVDDRILSMLELADQMYATTNGKLNIAMGSVLNIWHNYREAAEATETDADNKLPSMDEAGSCRPALRHQQCHHRRGRQDRLSGRPGHAAGRGQRGQGLCRGNGMSGSRGPRPDQCSGERGRQSACHRHKAGRQPVDRRCGKPVERFRPVHRQFHAERCHQHERYGPW